MGVEGSDGHGGSDVVMGVGGSDGHGGSDGCGG